MPMFEIEAYKVTTYLERFTSASRPARVLQMTGPVLDHGIQINRRSYSSTTTQ